MFRRKSRSLSSPNVAGGRVRKSRSRTNVRSQSMPVVPQNKQRLRSILRFVSVDDSLHNKYGKSNDAKREKKAESITFAHIEIREYARTIGDNPSCSSGPPISISWEHTASTKLSVETYETNRPPRRSNIQMILPRDVRQRMLKTEWNVTQSQIAAAVRTNIKIKNQRRTTVNNLGKSTKIEEAMENAGKGLSGLLGRNTDKKVQMLNDKMKAAESARKQRLLGEEMSSSEPEETAPLEDMDGN